MLILNPRLALKIEQKNVNKKKKCSWQRVTNYNWGCASLVTYNLANKLRE